MSKLLTRKPTRLKGFDYSNNGCYFVTICSHKRQNIFGKINENCVGAAGWPPVIKNYHPDNNIKLNEFGLIVQDELKNTENIRNEIKLDQYIIMPNHLHCIIIIDHKLTGGQPAAPTNNHIYKKTLSSFVSGFKSVVTKRINALCNTPKKPAWQRSFYDHIIRNDKSLNEIRQYIENNPLNWDNDENNINNN